MNNDLVRFFTADLHLVHDKILDKEFAGRPFASIAEHDTHVIDQINATVRARGDELFILGDYCWQRPGHYRARINCRSVHLIWGNHDKENYGRFFSTRSDVKMLKVRYDVELTVKLWLSHYPHAFWPSSHHGALHLYGHMHDQRELLLDALFPCRRSMDCGLDTAHKLLGEFKPFSQTWIVDRLMARPGHDWREHYLPPFA